MSAVDTARVVPDDWYPGTIPANARVDPGAYVETSYSFRLCRSRAQPAVTMAEGSSAYLGTMFDLGASARVRVGRYALLHGARIVCDDEVIIGDYALISWNVVIMDTYRVSIDPALRRHQLHSRRSAGGSVPGAGIVARPVTLEPNVWVGFDSCILPGVTVGEGAIVGARSVVVDDVPPYWVAAGNPARLIRSVQDEDGCG